MIDPGRQLRTILSFPPNAGSFMNSLVKGSDGRFYVAAGQGIGGEREASSRLMTLER